MARFKQITELIPILENEESHGEWIIDRVHAGTADDPKQMPFVGYGFAACRLMDAVNECVRANPELDARSYRDVLESYGITQWEHVDALDASACDARCTLSLIVNLIRTDRFSEGLLLEYLNNGKMLEWMRRLRELDER